MLVRFCVGKLNRFVRGHNRRGHIPTEEQNKRQSEFMEGNKLALGYKRTEESKRDQSQRLIGNTYLLGHIPTEETRQKIRAKLIGRPSSNKGRKHTEETRQKMRESQKRLWADPIHHKEQQSKMASGNRLQRPNKPEIQLMELLESIQPSDWKYVGDGSFVIGGRNPDFINVSGKKLIIEMFGDYWHRGENPGDRATIFEPFGFKTLVIWEWELKDGTKVVEKINEFVGVGA